MNTRALVDVWQASETIMVWAKLWLLKLLFHVAIWLEIVYFIIIGIT